MKEVSGSQQLEQMHCNRCSKEQNAAQILTNLLHAQTQTIELVSLSAESIKRVVANTLDKVLVQQELLLSKLSFAAETPHSRREAGHKRQSDAERAQERQQLVDEMRQLRKAHKTNLQRLNVLQTEKHVLSSKVSDLKAKHKQKCFDDEEEYARNYAELSNTNIKQHAFTKTMQQRLKAKDLELKRNLGKSEKVTRTLKQQLQSKHALLENAESKLQVAVSSLQQQRMTSKALSDEVSVIKAKFGKHKLAAIEAAKEHKSALCRLRSKTAAKLPATKPGLISCDDGSGDMFVADKDEELGLVGPRITGVCKNYDSKKGFGWISCDDGSGDVFVHQTQIYVEGGASAFRSLAKGEALEFNKDPDKMRAAGVTGPGGTFVKGQPRGGGKRRRKRDNGHVCRVCGYGGGRGGGGDGGGSY